MNDKTIETDALLGVLDEILAELRQLNARLGTAASQSSVEIKTSTRGTDIAAKAYAGSDITEAGNAAVAEYSRVHKLLEEQLMNGFAAEASKARG